MTFDINTVSAPNDNTYSVGIAFDDDGTATTGFIIVGKDSTQFIKAQQKIRAENYKRYEVKATRIDGTTDEGAMKTIEVGDKNITATAVAVTIGWFGFTENGAPAEFSSEKVLRIFNARPSWCDKVTNALVDESNFLPRSLTT